MAIKLTTTRQAAADGGIKALVYGGAGSGKTTLCATTGGNPLIISAEGGLMSLREHDLDVLEVSSIEDVMEAYKFINDSAEGKEYDWVCLDSLTEIAEVTLASLKAKTQDPRQAYGEAAETMLRLIKAFRDLPRNIFMTAKMTRDKDELSGAMLYGPMMPGRQLGPQLPYLFDLVFAYRTETDGEGQMVRTLQTFKDLQYDAKDRSGALAPFENPNLSAIAAKIIN